ncbi:MAG: hypothetical protein HY432_00110 [Candidatus Liptonbacteria bacterium]|nr:hypothetical protein [Candidatus Liptonbacteria bacterium]
MFEHYEECAVCHDVVWSPEHATNGSAVCSDECMRIANNTGPAGIQNPIHPPDGHGRPAWILKQHDKMKGGL